MNLNQITLPTNDIKASNAFYLTLGFTQIVDTEHYSRFECPEGEATFSLSLTDDKVYQGASIYFENKALDTWVEQLQTKGIEFDQLPEDTRYLWREAKLRDPSGNNIILYWAGENRKNPPWRVDIKEKG